MNNLKHANIVGGKEINLRDLFNVMKRRIWIVIVLTLLFTSVASIYSYFNKTTPLYESSARIIIGADPEYRNTLQVIIRDSSVLEKVVETLELVESPEVIANRINVGSIDNTQIVSISVVDTDPKRAADIANMTARVFKEEVPNIVEFSDVKHLSDAKVNPSPINYSNNNRIIIIGFVFGIIAGVGLIFLLDSLDDTIRSQREVEQIFGIPVIGKVSKIKIKNTKKLEKENEKAELEFRGETIGFK